MKVKLDQCWFWNCPKCKTRNYEHGVRFTVTEEEKSELEEMLLKGDHFGEELGPMMTQPENVTCSNCEHTYEAEPMDGLDIAP